MQFQVLLVYELSMHGNASDTVRNICDAKGHATVFCNKQKFRSIQKRQLRLEGHGCSQWRGMNIWISYNLSSQWLQMLRDACTNLMTSRRNFDLLGNLFVSDEYGFLRESSR